VQRLQYFLSESTWDSEQVNNRRLELLLSDPATARHDRGVLVIDDSGDRKDGTRTAHAGWQWLSRYGKTDNGSVTVTTVWADERVHYPLHAEPYTPVSLFPKKRGVLPKDAARGVSWGRPDDPAGWSPVQRRFRDGHTETWWTIDAQRGWWGPDGHTRLVVATTDPQTLPDKGNWYLATKLPGPAACTTTRASSRNRPTSPRWSGCTGSGTGSSKATSMSETSSDGLASKPAPLPRSAATNPWSTARSRSAGTPGSTHHPHTTPRPAAPEPPTDDSGERRHLSRLAG
jgi:DDE superfamily endonuclease